MGLWYYLVALGTGWIVFNLLAVAWLAGAARQESPGDYRSDVTTR
jgi:hypothetical protein